MARSKLYIRIWVVWIALLYLCPVSVIRAEELSGTIYYNGQPISEITSVQPEFRGSDLTLSQTLSNLAITYDNTTGEYTVGNLPLGPISMEVLFPVVNTSWTGPGNYRPAGSLYPDLATMTPAERAGYDINVIEIMHLTQPGDNSEAHYAVYPTDPYPVHPSGVLVDWDDVTGAAEYRLYVYRKRNPEHPSGYGTIETVATPIVADSYVFLDLPPLNPMEHFEISFYAYNDQQVQVGYYYHAYTNGYGWDYRFVTEQHAMMIDKMIVKAGREIGSDFYTIRGMLDHVEPNSFANGQVVALRLGELDPFLITEPLTQKGKKAKYSYKTPKLNLDLEKGKFSISAKDVDLGGLTAPVRVLLTCGNYCGITEAEDEGNNDVINGKKDLPVQLKVGHFQTLNLDEKKVKFSRSKDDMISKATVAGSLTFDTLIAQGPDDLFLLLGPQAWPLDATMLKMNKNQTKYTWTKPADGQDPTVVKVTVDFSKWTFTVSVKNSTVPYESGPIDFTLEFPDVGFSEARTLDIP